MSTGSISTTESKNDSLKGFGFALLATILWSGNYIVARALHKSVPPFNLAMFRWTVATIVLLPIAYKSLVQDRHKLLPNLKYLSLVALTGVTTFNTLIYVAGKYTTATNLALIGTTSAPVFVLLISFLFLRQRISLYKIAGTILCIIGIIVLISNGSWSQLISFQVNKGDYYVLGAALAFAIYTVLVRKKPKEISALTFLFSIFFLGTLFLIPAYLLELASGKELHWNASFFWVFLYLGVGASVISFLLWNQSIGMIGPDRTALFGNLIPVFSTIEAALLLDENFGWVVIISMILILSGITLANLNIIKSALKKPVS